MSNLKVNTINDASGGSAAVLYGVASPPNSMGFRNRLINSDMRIDQRNNGASVTVTSDGQYTLDRWKSPSRPASKFTVQQNAGAVTPPAGFTNYLGVTSSSAYSVAAEDYEAIQQRIEGFNFSDLGWGTANAQPITISFWVRSSLTGTFGGALYNASANRSYPFTYTVSAANTWEQKTFTVQGDTSGTWLMGTNAGLSLTFGLGVGSTYSGTAGTWAGTLYFSATGATSVVGTNGATFYITGVQLEAGTVATPFERRDYGRELMMCQRYFQKSYDMATVGGAATFVGLSFIGAGTQGAGLTTGYMEGREPFPVRMRASPTVIGWDSSGNLGKCTRFNPNTANNVNESAGFNATERYVNCNSISGSSANTLGFHWYCSSEL